MIYVIFSFKNFYLLTSLMVFYIHFAETYWDNCALGWSLVQIEFFNINWCVLLYKWFIFILFLSWFFSFCSMFPKSTHETFSMKLFQNLQAHPRLEKAKFSETDFTVSHYAGKACHMSRFFFWIISCDIKNLNNDSLTCYFFCRSLITQIPS